MPMPLCEFIHDLRYDDLPEDVRAFARRLILDLTGVAIAGPQTDMSRIIRTHAARQFGVGDRAARMICDGRRVSPAGAALAGGITIDSLDAHDGHKLTRGHVGCGVYPAYLAQDGFTCAPADTFEGAHIADLWSDLGGNWRIFEQYYKAYPICRWAQPPVQAVLNLRAAHGVTSDAVDHIEVTTFHQSLRLATRRPETTEQAQYSTAFPTAAAVVRGQVAAAEVEAGAFNDPEILRLAGSMVIAESDAYDAAFPARRIADVTLVMKDGGRLVSGPTEARGDPEAPVDIAEVAEKFHAFSDPLIGRKRADTAETAISGLGNGQGLAALQDVILEAVG